MLATAESFLRSAVFDRQFQTVTVDGADYTIGRYSERERRDYLHPIYAAMQGRSEAEIATAINARFLQLTLWAAGREQRLLATLDASGRDTQFDGDSRLNQVIGVLNADELHGLRVLNAVLTAFPEYAQKNES